MVVFLIGVGVLLLNAFCSLGAIYEVGPGKQFSSIGQAPWATLQPGDQVLIYWRSTPYKEKWVIGRSGTQFAPISVIGIQGPSGELPVIDGDGAVTAPGLLFWNEDRAVIKIGGSNTPSSSEANWIVISNLEIRGARTGAQFFSHGVWTPYLDNAAGITLERGSNVTISQCSIHDNGNGIFLSSSGGFTKSISIDRNYVYANGYGGGDSTHHNTYTEAQGIVYQYNHFGPLQPGSQGNNVKDRSAGLVVRYNWIEGGSRCLDLVDSGTPAVLADPGYPDGFIYGNILIKKAVDDNAQIIHWGGDSPTTANYRPGTMYFYNNTVISERTDNTALVFLSTLAQSADIRNNIVMATIPSSQLAILAYSGVASLKNNWLTAGWVTKPSGSYPGVVNDLGGQITGTDPGFLSAAGQEFGLLPGSVAIDKSTTLPSAAASNPVTQQYIKHQKGISRLSLLGATNILDLGATEKGFLVTILGGVQVTGTIGNNGWYRSNVSLSWAPGDPEFGVPVSSSCLPAAIIADTAGSNVVCTATNAAGARSMASATVRVDKTPPSLGCAASPAANANGWNNSTVTVSFTGFDAMSGLATVSSPVTITGEGSNQMVSGAAVDQAGNASSASCRVNLDRTAPDVTVQFDPLAKDIVVSGRDSLSGISADPQRPVSVSTTVIPGPGGSGKTTEFRVYRLIDLAGNSLNFALTVTRQQQSLQVALMPPVPNAAALATALFDWTGGGLIQRVTQPAAGGAGDVEARFDPVKNQTTITVHPANPGTVVVRPGLVLLRIGTDKAKPSISY